MLRRSGLQALQALLELARHGQQWSSVSAIATAQELPAPMLEQLLLQLRRAELVESRRGRQGGYRLSRSPEAIPVAEVLDAVGAPLQLSEGPAEGSDGRAETQVLQSMGQRLQNAIERELKQLTLQELLFDLESWKEYLSNEGGLMLG
ncbi:Rrf2 family transcriptional regulator [Vulcanococcus sp.]|jgi:Rrf2 family iron-sulfur cluster assembly transcriptional regulator|uniref:Rrf2 family transcriptional regulator n=1 Tax=Vulcanococcus sp. TaxID=2856995 RepID=UPI00322EDE73